MERLSAGIEASRREHTLLWLVLSALFNSVPERRGLALVRAIWFCRLLRYVGLRADISCLRHRCSLSRRGEWFEEKQIDGCFGRPCVLYRGSTHETSY